MNPRIPSPPPDIVFAINLAPFKGILVDFATGATRGMRTEQPGWPTASSEVVANQPKYGDRAGITDSNFQRFVFINGQYSQIMLQHPRVAKAREILRESLAYVDDQRHKLATQFACSAERHASLEGGDPTLLTAYEKTIAYRGVIAEKAVKTKAKKQQAKSAAAPAPAAPAPAAPAPPAPTPAAPAPAVALVPPPDKGTASALKIPAAPPDAIFKIDLLPLKGFLVDLPPGVTRGMRTAQEGWTSVVDEIVGNQPKLGGRAGITETDFQRFVDLNAEYDQILSQIPIVTKAEEVVSDTLSHLDNQRHKLLSAFATSAEAHAAAEGGDPTLLAAYEKTIAYRGVTAEKGQRTRRKNEEAKNKPPGAPAPSDA